MAATHAPGCGCTEKTVTITSHTATGGVIARTWGIPGCLADQLAGTLGPPVLETAVGAGKMAEAGRWVADNALTTRGGGGG